MRVKWHERRRVPPQVHAAEAVLSPADTAEINVRSLTRLWRVQDDIGLVEAYLEAISSVKSRLPTPVHPSHCVPHSRGA
jgi:hypothetical protein